jgi:cellulose synthase operon protein B
VQQQRLDQRNPTSVVFVETRPFSVTNTRQVLANWLSANMIFYAAALLGLCTILGLATSMMLKGLGRK